MIHEVTPWHSYTYKMYSTATQTLAWWSNTPLSLEQSYPCARQTGRYTSLLDSETTSQILWASYSPGYSEPSGVPFGGQIEGIEVEIVRYTGCCGYHGDTADVQVVIGGFLPTDDQFTPSVISNNLSTGAMWPRLNPDNSEPPPAVFGGPLNMWGFTSVDPSMYNYKVGMQVARVDATQALPAIECVRIRYFYNIECSLSCTASMAISTSSPGRYGYYKYAGTATSTKTALCDSPVTYRWDLSDGQHSDEQNPIFWIIKGAGDRDIDWTMTAAVDTLEEGGSGAMCVQEGTIAIRECIMDCATVTDKTVVSAGPPVDVTFTTTYAATGSCGTGVTDVLYSFTTGEGAGAGNVTDISENEYTYTYPTYGVKKWTAQTSAAVPGQTERIGCGESDLTYYDTDRGIVLIGDGLDNWCYVGVIIKNVSRSGFIPYEATFEIEQYEEIKASAYSTAEPIFTFNYGDGTIEETVGLPADNKFTHTYTALGPWQGDCFWECSVRLGNSNPNTEAGRVSLYSSPCVMSCDFTASPLIVTRPYATVTFAGTHTDVSGECTTGPGHTQYSWVLRNETNPTVPDITYSDFSGGFVHNFQYAGTYSVYMTVTKDFDGGLPVSECTKVKPNYIVVNNIPQCSIVCSAVSDLPETPYATQSPVDVTFTANIVHQDCLDVSYRWEFWDGSAQVHNTSPVTHTFACGMSQATKLFVQGRTAGGTWVSCTYDVPVKIMPPPNCTAPECHMAPVIGLNEPYMYQQVTMPFTARWMGCNGTLPLSYRVRLDAGGWSAYQLEDYYVIDGLLPGTHTFFVEGKDAQNVVAAAVYAYFTVVPGGAGSVPVVSITRPANGELVTSQPYLASWSGTGGTGALTYDLEIDDVSIFTGSSATTYSMSGLVDSPPSHTIKVTVHDSASPSQSSSDTNTFTVGTPVGQPLSIVMNTPPAGWSITQPYTASWTATGGVEPYSYSVSIDNGVPTVQGTSTFIIDGLDGDSSHEISVVVTDSDAPNSTAEVSRNFNIASEIEPPPDGGIAVHFVATSGFDMYSWTFGDGNSAATCLTGYTPTPPATCVGSSTPWEIVHTYEYRDLFHVTVTGIKNGCGPEKVANIDVDLRSFSTDFTYTISDMTVTFTPSSSGGLNETSPRYYLFDFGDEPTTGLGYYYVTSGTGPTCTDPCLPFEHIFEHTGSHTVILQANEGGKSKHFTSITGGRTTFDVGASFVAGSIIVLYGEDDNHLELLTPGSGASQYVETSTGITLNTGATAGYTLQLAYVVPNIPSYSNTAEAIKTFTLGAGALQISITPGSGQYCFEKQMDFTATITGASTSPYTYSWLFDDGCVFTGGGYYVDINGVTHACDTPKVDSDVAATSDTVSNVRYNMPDGANEAKQATITVTVTDADDNTGYASVTVTLPSLPFASAAGAGYRIDDSYRFQSYNTPDTSYGTLAAKYKYTDEVQLGTLDDSRYTYAWAPHQYLSSPDPLLDPYTIAQPICSLPYVSSSEVLSQQYSLTVTQKLSPKCVNTSSVTVIKPTVQLTNVSVTGIVGGDRCHKQVTLSCSIDPVSDGLALIVERVTGTTGAVSYLGNIEDVIIMDKSRRAPCSDAYILGGDSSKRGGICILDSQHWMLGESFKLNRVATKVTAAHMDIVINDAVCSTAGTIDHDYRIRLIDIGGCGDADITEDVIVAQYEPNTMQDIYTVAISNDISRTISDVANCNLALVIEPGTTTYNEQGSAWSETIEAEGVPTGFTPTSWTWAFDNPIPPATVGDFEGTDYYYTSSVDTNGKATIIYHGPSETSEVTKRARVTLTCGGRTPGGANVNVSASYVDYIFAYRPACSVTGCSISATDVGGNPISGGEAPLEVYFSASATASYCSTSDIEYRWDFGDSSDVVTGKTPVHTYTDPSPAGAPYHVVVTAKVDGMTCTATKDITVTGTCLVDSCIATVNSSNPATIPPYTVVTLGGSIHMSGYSCPTNTIAWSYNCPGANPSTKSGTAIVVGGSASIPGGTTVTTAVPRPAEPYSWSLVWDPDGIGTTCSAQVTITDACGCNIAPVSDAIAPSTAYINTPVVFSANITSSNCLSTIPTSVEMNFGDGVIDTTGGGSGNIRTWTHTYTQSASRAWSIIAYYGEESCTSHGTISICELTCDFTYKDVLQIGEVCTFTPTVQTGASGTSCGTGTYSYDWNFGDGTAHSALRQPTHAYAAPGTYTVTLTVSDGTHTATSVHSVTVSTCPINCTWSYAVTSPANNAWYQVEQDASALAGLSYRANTAVQSQCGSGTWNYAWDFPCGANSFISVSGDEATHVYVGTTGGHTYNCLGAQVVTLDTKFNGVSLCSSTPTTGTVNVVSLTSTATATPDSYTPKKYNFSVTPNWSAGSIAAPLNSQYTYAWTFGDGATSTEKANTSHIYAANGTYNWSVRVSWNTPAWDGMPSGKLLYADYYGTIVVNSITAASPALVCVGTCTGEGNEQTEIEWTMSWSGGTPNYSVKLEVLPDITVVPNVYNEYNMTDITGTSTSYTVDMVAANLVPDQLYNGRVKYTVTDSTLQSNMTSIYPFSYIKSGSCFTGEACTELPTGPATISIYGIATWSTYPPGCFPVGDDLGLIMRRVMGTFANSTFTGNGTKTVTVNTVTAHGLATDDLVTITGTGVPRLNVTSWPITVTGATTFTYTYTGTNTYNGTTTGTVAGFKQCSGFTTVGPDGRECTGWKSYSVAYGVYKFKIVGGEWSSEITLSAGSPCKRVRYSVDYDETSCSPSGAGSVTFDPCP